jgi:hypothetical protein
MMSVQMRGSQRAADDVFRLLPVFSKSQIMKDRNRNRASF